jgi:hypothetical protein
LFSSENFSTDRVGSAIDDIDTDASSVLDIIVARVDDVPVTAFLLKSSRDEKTAHICSEMEDDIDRTSPWSISICRSRMNGLPRVTSSRRFGEAFANTASEEIQALIDVSGAEIAFPEMSRTSRAGKAEAGVEERGGSDERRLKETFSSRRLGSVPSAFINERLEIALCEASIDVIDSEFFSPVRDVNLFRETFKSFRAGKNSAKNEALEVEPAPPPPPPPVLLLSEISSETPRSPDNELLLRLSDVKFFIPPPLVPRKAFNVRISLCEASSSSSERREPMPSKFESLFPSTRKTRRNFKKESGGGIAVAGVDP